MTSQKRPRASFPLWYLGIDTTHVLVSALFQIQNSSQYLRLGTGGAGGETYFLLHNLSVLLHLLFYRKHLFLFFFKGQFQVLEQKHAAGCQCWFY